MGALEIALAGCPAFGQVSSCGGDAEGLQRHAGRGTFRSVPIGRQGLLLALVICAGVLAASAVTVHRSFSGGYPAGTSTQSGAYRDSMGRLQGTVRTSGGKTDYRDAMGRLQGTARTSGGKTEYRDSMGRLQMTARENGGKTEYRDAQGRLIGTSTTDSSGRTTYRDAQGRVQGTR